MLDIHPAHHAATTWRDFFIHIATIVLGLLIAIGLEQTVEWLHHRTEIGELRLQLKQDSEKEFHDTMLLIRANSANRRWLAGRSDQVLRALESHTPLLPLPVPHEEDYDLPNEPAWNAARTNGTLALLPHEDAQAFGEIDFGIVQVDSRYEAVAIARSKRVVLEQQLSAPEAQQHNANAVGDDNLRQYLNLLRDEAAAEDRLLSIARQLAAAQTAILHGERNLTRIQAEEDRLHETL